MNEDFFDEDGRLKLALKKVRDVRLGNLRISRELYKRLNEIAEQENVSPQEVARAILHKVLDNNE